MLKLLLSTNQIFRHEKKGKTLTLFYYKITLTELSPVNLNPKP